MKQPFTGFDITVIIPTAGMRRIALRSAIDSALAQTEKCAEVIVIWDAVEIPIDFLSEYPNITFLKTGQNGKGVAHARNCGLTHSKTKYIALLDDDDYWPENKIERYLKEMNSYNELGFYVSKSAYFDENDQLLSVCPMKHFKPGTKLTDYLNRRILPMRRRITLPTSTYVFPRVGPKGGFRFDESALLAEDYLMLYELNNYFEFRLIGGEALCRTRIHSASKSGLSHRRISFEDWKNFYGEKFNFLPKQHFDNSRIYFGIYPLFFGNGKSKTRYFIDILKSKADVITKTSSILILLFTQMKILILRVMK